MHNTGYPTYLVAGDGPRIHRVDIKRFDFGCILIVTSRKIMAVESGANRHTMRSDLRDNNNKTRVSRNVVREGSDGGPVLTGPLGGCLERGTPVLCDNNAMGGEKYLPQVLRA